MAINTETDAGNQAIGFVGALTGTAIARGEDGTERTLQIGDPVYANDIIITGELSTIVVDFMDGTRLDLGRESQAVLDSDVFDPASLADATDVAATAEAMQQAILAGKDPSEIFEAPAAGEEAPGDEGGHSAVAVDLTGQRVTPQSGFETTGLEFAFPEPPEEIPGVEEEPAPQPYITLAGIESDNVLVKEDSSAQVAVSGGTNDGSAMDAIVITGLDGGWGYNISGLIHDGATASISGTTLTIDLSGYTGGLTYAGTFTVIPPADSDVDLGSLSGTLTAHNIIDPTVTAAAGDTVFVYTDAVADLTNVSITVNDSGDTNASFQTGETGSVTVSAGFGDASDASETHLVTVTLPAGFSASGLSGDYSIDGQVITWTVTGTSFNTSFDVTNDSAPDGSYSFNAVSSAEETNLSGTETDTGDNLKTDAASAPAVVAGIPITNVTLGGIEGGSVIVEEDGSQTVSLSANTSDGSAMDTIVITGLDSGWTYDFSGLEAAGVDASDITLSGTTLTIDLSGYTGGTTYSGSFTVAPPADTHLDLGTLNATVSAHNTTDPAVIGTDSDSFDVITDAVADTPTVGITVADSADGDSTFEIGETGTVNVTASFGDVTDSSETHLVTVTVPDGFTIDEGSLSGSYTVDGQVITWTVSGTNLNTSFNVTNDSAVNGSYNFTAVASAEETNLAPGSDTEPDTGDNYVEVTASDSVGVFTPEPSPNVLNGVIITNTNNQSQVLRITFTEYEEGEPTGNTFTTLMVLEEEGQHGDTTTEFAFDVGFEIKDGDPDYTYDISLQYVSGPKIIVTDVEIEGVEIHSKGGGPSVKLTADPGHGEYHSMSATIIPATQNPDGSFQSDGDTVPSGGVFTTSIDAPADEYDNVLEGTDGIDTLSGGDGNDALHGGESGDFLHGGAGEDTVTYFDSTDGVTVDLNDQDGVATQSGGDAEGDVLTGIENVIGSDDKFESDTLTGDSNDNVLLGLAGDDTLIGGDGDDVLVGGMGDDTIDGGPGADLIIGNADADSNISGGPGADTFRYLSMNDVPDIITDFDTSDGDVLDIAMVLDGYDAGTDDLTDFVQVTNDGTHSTVWVNPTGSGSFVELATLENSLISTDVNQLVDDGNLVVTEVF